MKRSWSLILALLTLAFFSTADLKAEPAKTDQAPCANQAPCPQFGAGGPCAGYHGQGPRQFQSITPEQRAKYKAIMDEYRPKLRELADQLFILENELQALKHAVQPDVKAVRSTATEIVKVRNERRELKQIIHQRLQKECGIKLPERPIPGVDMPAKPAVGVFSAS
ncbi:MAG: periplasmic heavy metal sensor, partial [Desulfovibrio sp.]|nr:periplasmic heavy metal sensor [Desulfovibrio sp.]